jgi:uncharacterized protein YPO0396
MESLFESLANFKGFRLEWFEFLNWGVFNGSVNRLNLNLQNSLLSGEIGSGKSTIVDALTTLLLPTNKVVYNKAAGAKAKERTLQSYILGEYKKGIDEFGVAHVKRLRDENSFSMLLGKFKNEGLMEEVYLGLFLSVRNSQVVRVYFISKEELGIKEFVNIKNLREFKKALREKAQIFESYKDYFNAYKKILGIRNIQAMDLFYRTVSMKSVENLNGFIREHMLENRSLEDIVDEMVFSFKELKHAHDLVLEAKREIELLSEIEKTYENYKNVLEILEKNRKFLEKLEGVFAKYELARKREILTQKQISLETERKNSEEKRAKKERLNEELISLKTKFSNKGGGRVDVINERLKTLQNELVRKELKLEKYKKLLKRADIPFSRDFRNFLKLKEEIKDKLEKTVKEKETLSEVIDSLKYTLKRHTEELENLDDEIIYLKTRKTNIPAHLSKVRDEMEKKLNVKLPFAAELIEVENKKFEGVVERILRNFGMSMLVDESIYDKVSEYVNSNHLGIKLVYLKIANKDYGFYTNDDKRLLVNNINVKNSKFRDYIFARIAKDFDYILCENLEEFKRYKKAATKEGLVKSDIRNEKDDRSEIDDKSRYILGSNAEKLNALLKKREIALEKTQHLKKELQKNLFLLDGLEEKREVYKEIIKTEFEDIDKFGVEKEIETLEKEKEKLLKDTELNKLEEEIKNTEISIRCVEDEISKTDRKIGELTGDISRLNLDISALEKTALEDEEFENEFHIKNMPLEKLAIRKREIAEELKSKNRSYERSKENYKDTLIRKMSRYLDEFRHFAKYADAGTESTDEFLKRLKKLKDDDLPRFEEDFRRHFEEGTLHNILKINEEMSRFLKEIKSKIALINKNLKDIEYNPSTFIEIDIKPSKDRDLKEFRDSLKYLSGNIAQGLNEDKFDKIKTLIARLQGEDESVEKKWRQKVCDVRNYYTFAAVERYYDGEVKEYYSDSSGKSGGQKEKLAYTILASALSYQFSLLDENPKSRTFRFAMIDEAFGRGSDESARYALELFKKLDLQMLIVTPKQKINVIAPYVGSIHFVANKNNESVLFDVGIEKVNSEK